MKYVAYCTKGLEEIVASEITSKINDAQILEISSKRIIYDSKEDLSKLMKLRTVDDLGLLVTSNDDVNSLDDLSKRLNEIDFKGYFQTISEYRNIKKKFSITTSIVGAKKLKVEEVVKEIVSTIQSKHPWKWVEFDHTNFDIRVFIDYKKMYMSIRLTKESLRHRPYKIASKPGSLKPTIAAAMILLSQQKKTKLNIVDNFCGSGTILCESLATNNDVYGGDIDAESVSITRNNLEKLHYGYLDRIKHLNATKTNWPNGFFDSAISNLPWDKQITVDSITNLYIGTLEEYKRILKPNGTLCLLVSKPELLIKHAKRIFNNPKINSIKIGLLGQNPSLVLVKN